MHDAPRVSPVNQISHHATFEQCFYNLRVHTPNVHDGRRERKNHRVEESLEQRKREKRETRGFRPPDAAIKSEGAPPRETRKVKECERAKESERDGRVIEAEFE